MIHQSKTRWNGFSLRIEFSLDLHISKQSIPCKGRDKNRDWRELIFLENCIEVRIYDHLNFFTTFLYPKNGKVPKFIST